MSDSSDIDNALVAKLGADPELLALCPNGVYFGIAPPGASRFVLVSIVEAVDLRTYDGRAGESIRYAVKAVMHGGDSKAAAARIDALLDDQPLTVAGYLWASTVRDPDDPRIRYPEADDKDTTLIWQHRGGNYRVEMARA
jgi:hypothetical protein